MLSIKKYFKTSKQLWSKQKISINISKNKAKQKQKIVFLEENILDLKAMKVSVISWLSKLYYESEWSSRNIIILD